MSTHTVKGRSSADHSIRRYDPTWTNEQLPNALSVQWSQAPIDVSTDQLQPGLCNFCVTEAAAKADLAIF